MRCEVWLSLTHEARLDVTMRMLREFSELRVAVLDFLVDRHLGEVLKSLEKVSDGQLEEYG